MRPRVDWMNQTDDRVLELLDESDLILSPAVVAMNLDYTRNWVSRRMSKLSKAELIEEVERGYYRISSKGRAYLSGEIDAVELENSE
ncbi:MarR family transcriptional regulator [Haloferax sp. Atlit-47N]|uniref:MarR family transcriptional regulator n=1 Tax=Haloferax sp. Atlit-47N TaxID=2077199 RepID=UPI000E273D36|nr:MarR family transcriptional regulator [Haloferax sp. Atlit-47N]